MRTLYLDLETNDTGLKNREGAAWGWSGVGTNPMDVQLLCCSYAFNDDKVVNIDMTEEEGKQLLHKLLAEADELVAYNAQYEIGCLVAAGYDLAKLTVYDPQIGCRLYDNTHMSYSMDNMAKRYLNEEKDVDLLVTTVIQLGLVKQETRAVKAAYNNMDKLWELKPSVVAKYCDKDVEIMRKLHKMILNGVSIDTYKYFCKLPAICVKIRRAGVKLDMEALEKAEITVNQQITEQELKLKEEVGEVNIQSPKQMIELAYKLGLKPRMTQRANGTTSESVDAKWLKDQKHTVCDAILHIKKLKKAVGFFKGLRKYQKNGRIHPQLNILQARTGRFSCSDPNMQQIPSRDPVLGPLFRSLFIANTKPDNVCDAERWGWYSLDFSAQEPRMAIHWAAKLHKIGQEFELTTKWGKKKFKCQHQCIRDLVAAYTADPRLDSHKYNAAIVYKVNEEDVTKEQRNSVKHITLGAMYGMGVAKLAATMNLPDAIAAERKAAFNAGSPWIRLLADACTACWQKRGWLKLVSGRISKTDGNDYKALNSLIQGSAADQLIEVMIQADEAGIPMQLPVHDEINFSGTENQAKKLQDIMENALTLEVPSITDIGYGKNWNQAH